tara:strand:- start:23604 stop:23855 length:252 start_codon:yes stop_codon:yes gene_type:complete
MKITFEYPELCLLLSVLLYTTNHSVFAWILFALSLVLGMGRLGLANQKAQQESQAIDSALLKVRDTLLNLATSGHGGEPPVRH